MPVFELRVSSVRRATPSSRTIRLDLQGVSFGYRAGQLAVLGLPGESLRIPYSIASAPAESAQHGYIEFLTRRDPESRLREIRRGARLALEGPLGSFTLPDHQTERDLLFVAGGTGIAPLRSMIVEAITRRAPGRMRLLYSARSPAEFAYLNDLRALERAGHLQLALTATREVPARWRGTRGRITPERLAPLIDNPQTLCFVCGPTAMVDAVPKMLTDLGIDRSRIRMEEW